MTAPDRPLRAGLIGYGLAGAVFHAPLVSAVPGLSLDFIVTSAPERRQAARAAHPEALLLERAEQLWERAGELDFVVVAAPNRSHVSLAEAALEAGLAVVVDKPLCRTVAEARALAERAEARGLVLAVFQNRRWDGDFMTVRGLVERGELGPVWRFESRFERWAPTEAPGWRGSADPAELGGMLYDLGAHLVDQALVLFGPAVSVYAEADVRREGTGADDDSFIALTHASGTRSQLWMSAATAQPGPRFRVLGARSGFVKHGLDPQEAALAAGARPGPGWGAEPEESFGLLGAQGPGGPGLSRVPTVPGSYQVFYEALEACLRGEAAPPVTAWDVLGPLAVLEAAVESARECRVVHLEDGR